MVFSLQNCKLWSEFFSMRLLLFTLLIKTKLRWDNVTLIKSNIVILSWNRTSFYTKSIIMKTITPKILIKIIPDGWYDDVIKIWMTFLINTHKLRDHKQICRCFEPFAVVLEGLSFWRLLTIRNHHGEQSNKHHLKLRQLLAKLLTNPCLCVPTKLTLCLQNFGKL